MCLLIAYYVYIHNMYIIYIYYVYIYIIGGNVYIPRILLLYILQIHVQTLNYINCNYKCNIIPYSHFPHVLSPLCVYTYTLWTVLTVSSNIIQSVSKRALQLRKRIEIYTEDIQNVLNCQNIAKHAEVYLG